VDTVQHAFGPAAACRGGHLDLSGTRPIQSLGGNSSGHPDSQHLAGSCRPRALARKSGILSMSLRLMDGSVATASSLAAARLSGQAPNHAQSAASHQPVRAAVGRGLCKGCRTWRRCQSRAPAPCRLAHGRTPGCGTSKKTTKTMLLLVLTTACGAEHRSVRTAPTRLAAGTSAPGAAGAATARTMS